MKQPLDRDASREATRLLRDLADARDIGPRDRAVLAENTTFWAGLGHAGDALALTKAWAARGHRDTALAQATAVYAMLAAPASSASLGSLGPAEDADALGVVGAFMRGELEHAVAIAEGHAFFATRHDQAGVYGCVYGAWALALIGRSADAEKILAGWWAASASTPARARQFILRGQAWIHGFERRYARELALVREALAVCEDADLTVEAAFVEVELANAFLHVGDATSAAACMATWESAARESRGAIGNDRGLLSAYRDLARMEFALHAGDEAQASSSGERALAFFESCGNAVLACDARLGLCLASWSRGDEGALEAYRLRVYRSPMAHQMGMLRKVETAFRLRASGHALILRSQSGERAVPAIRLWRPSLDFTGADLFVDAIAKTVTLRGRGPFSLDDRPVLERLLMTLVLAPRFTMSVEALFSAVWEAAWNPLVHENKLHVTLHRLRGWLDAHVPGTAMLVKLADGEVSIDARADVRVLLLSPKQPHEAVRTANATLTATLTGAAPNAKAPRPKKLRPPATDATPGSRPRLRSRT